MGLIANSPTLTRREREVGRMLVDEHLIEEIANELMVEQHVVRMHRQNLYRKLDIKSRKSLKHYRELLED